MSLLCDNMINKFEYWYASISDKSGFLRKCRFYSCLRFLIRNLANIILPIYFKLTAHYHSYKLQVSEKRSGRIIVSLTSFPKRINRLWLVIESLLRQTHKPDMIVLWLSEEQFPTLDALPKSLLNLQSRGLNIEIEKEDFRSHKKYCYALKKFPDDIIFTVDDDIFYDTNMIELMYKTHCKYPDIIICNYAFEMRYNLFGNLLNYSEWQLIQGERISRFDTFFGTGGGVLFPPNSFYEDVVDNNLFITLCPLADDVWLNAMVRLKGKKILKVSLANNFLPIIYRNNSSLYTINVNQNMNDKQIENIRSYYLINKHSDPFACQ